MISFEFEISNNDPDLTISIDLVIFDLNPTNGSVAFPGTITSLKYRPPNVPAISVPFICQNYTHVANVFIIEKAASKKVYGNLRTSSDLSFHYPLPFIMKVSLNWSPVATPFLKDGVASISKTIEPDR